MHTPWGYWKDHKQSHSAQLAGKNKDTLARRSSLTIPGCITTGKSLQALLDPVWGHPYQQSPPLCTVQITNTIPLSPVTSCWASIFLTAKWNSWARLSLEFCQSQEAKAQQQGKYNSLTVQDQRLQWVSVSSGFPQNLSPKISWSEDREGQSTARGETKTLSS